MGVVFAKTAKGQAEMANRSGSLSPRIRRVLIFVDGKRSVDDIRELVHADDLTHTLGLLEEDDYIAVAGVTDDVGELQTAEEPLPSITAFRPLDSRIKPAELDMAKNFMINTLRTFTGPYDKIGLMQKVQEAPSHAALREYFDEWYRAVVDTLQGRRRAEELRTQLLKVI